MTKGYTSGEFIQYLKGLKFDRFMDMLRFVEAYMNHYQTVVKNNEHVDVINDAYLKYSLAISIYGPSIMKYCILVEEEMEQIDAEQSNSSVQSIQ